MFDPLKTWEAPAPPRTYPTHTRFNNLPHVPRQDYGVPMVPIDTRPMPSFFNSLPPPILQNDPPATQASPTPRPQPEPPASQGSIQTRPVHTYSHLQSTCTLPVPRPQTETPQHQTAFGIRPVHTYFNDSFPVPEPRPDPPATEITPGIGTVQTQILFLPRTHTDPPGLQAALETRPTHTYFDEPPSVGRPSNEPPQIPVPLEAEPAHTYFIL